MPVTTKIEPLDREVMLSLTEDLSPKLRAQALALFAEDEIEKAKRQNARVIGAVPRYTQTVDGVRDAPIRSVKAEGVIFVEFIMLQDVLQWIGEQLVEHSPVSDPAEDHQPDVTYAESHRLYADGAIVPLGGPIPEADTYHFINAVKYARKIELGSSSQAPDGVYQAVSILARQRFGNIAKIVFTYETIHGGERNPAIRVSTR